MTAALIAPVSVRATSEAPTSVKKQTVTAVATTWPEGEEKPAGLTVVYANV